MIKTKSEMLCAIDYWMGVECLSPSEAPKPIEDDAFGTITWDIDDDNHLPWIDPLKIEQLAAFKNKHLSKYEGEPEWTFVAYGSLMDTPAIFQEIRTMFSPEGLNHVQFREGQPAAALALALDSRGLATGDVFISSLPWAMGKLGSTPQDRLFDFSGFFGVQPEDLQQKLTAELLKMSKEQLNILAEDADASVPAQALTLQAVQVLTNFIFQRCGWIPRLSSPLRVKAKLSSKSKTENKDDIQLLNSFYVEDLKLISAEVEKDNTGVAFTSFMSGGDESQRVDVRIDTNVVSTGVMPGEIPLGRWPSRFGLVYAQQFATNTIMKKLADGSGMFSVNGPPGTGKTTLLRDVVANVIVNRAMVMATYDSIDEGFKETLSIDGWKYGTIYKLDHRLCGHGIVVASANNGAVENITHELPGIEAIPKACDLRYFAELSDSIFSSDKQKRDIGATWGIAAAALGNKTNRNAFFKRLKSTRKNGVKEEPHDRLLSLWDIVDAARETNSWADAKASFLSAQERSRKARERMKQLSESIVSIRKNEQLLPEAEQKRDRASSEVGALQCQQDALIDRQKIAESLAAVSEKEYQAAQKVHQHATELAVTRHRHEGQLRELLVQFEGGQKERPGKTISELRLELEEAEKDIAVSVILLRSLQENKPNWFQRLLTTRTFRAWRDRLTNAEFLLSEKDALKTLLRREIERCQPIFDRIQKLETAISWAEKELQKTVAEQGLIPTTYVADLAAADKTNRAKKAEHARIIGEIASIKPQLNKAKVALDLAHKCHSELFSKIVADRKILDSAGIGGSTMREWLNEGVSEDEIQRREPWHDAEFSEARQELFCSAMRLHQAFVAHGFGKIKNTLTALIAMNNGGIQPGSITGGAHHLWEMLFLVVPVLSTSFASFSRMFQGCGRESLGWLLIDEAGQSTPQQALGAIWRSRRVVVVGDPLQLEPIIQIPPEALLTLQRRCNAGDHFSLIGTSAQVLADKANQFGTSIGQSGGRQGKPANSTVQPIWIGSPLRVHRRCLSPMFDISNGIAYEGMMVHGLRGEEYEREENEGWAGNSCWIDMPATQSIGHCINAQVKFGVKLAKALAKMSGLKTRGKFNVYVITPFNDVNKGLEQPLFKLFKNKKKGMHGTVHTFQGKEADVVIMVLGGQPKNDGVITGFAAAKANLLNVAVTRAKKRLYVIGDFDHWSRFDYFSDMSEILPRKSEAEMSEVIQGLADLIDGPELIGLHRIDLQNCDHM